MTAPSAVSSPLQGFNGFTSEVTTFDGTTPNCYTPTSSSLNGHLRGINNKLCTLRDSITTLRYYDTLLVDRIDSIITALEGIQTDVDGNNMAGVTSTGGTVTVSSAWTGDSVTFNLAVNIDSIKAKIVRSLDYTCLGVPNNFDSIMNKLIEIACEVNEEDADSCRVWQLYSTTTLSSTVSSVGISVTPYSVGATPSGMCINTIQYIYTVFDSLGAALANGVVTAGYTLGAATVWSVPFGYIQGARTVRILTRFYKERCTSLAYCGIWDSTETTNVPVVSLTALVANDDSYTNSTTTAQSYNLFTNDVVPYTVSSVTLTQGSTIGVASVATTGILSYTPVDEGDDTLQYQITDIYGQTATAYVYITNNVSSTPAFTVSGMIDLCVQSATTVRVFNNLTIGNKIGNAQLYGMTYTNDTGLVVTILNPLLPVFTGLQSVQNGADLILSNLYKFSNFNIDSVEANGGDLTITLLVTNLASESKLLDINIPIPSGIKSTYVCGTDLLENTAYTILEYDLP